jgi:hypothetical protein
MGSGSGGIRARITVTNTVLIRRMRDVNRNRDCDTAGVLAATDDTLWVAAEPVRGRGNIITRFPPTAIIDIQ